MNLLIKHLQAEILKLYCVHTMPAQFENGEKCDGSKTGASVHTIPEQFGNCRKSDGKILVARLDVKEMYLHSKNRSVSFQNY